MSDWFSQDEWHRIYLELHANDEAKELRKIAADAAESGDLQKYGTACANYGIYLGIEWCRLAREGGEYSEPRSKKEWERHYKRVWPTIKRRLPEFAIREHKNIRIVQIHKDYLDPAIVDK